MKKTNIIPAIAALAFITNPASAQDYIEHDATIQLTVSTQQYGDVVEKENGDANYKGMIVETKLDNKQVLNLLVADGEISDIKGWRIVFISYDGKSNDVMVVHKDGEYFSIWDYVQWYVNFDDATKTYKGLYDESEDSYSETGTFKTEGSVNVDDEDSFYWDVGGIFTGRYEDELSGSLLVSGKFEHLTGDFEDDGGFEGLVSGTTSLGNGSPFSPWSDY